MAITKHRSKLKGLADIRTLSGRGVSEQQVYQVYLKLGALEMEKLRRQKEQNSAFERINNISHRLKDIDDEIDLLCQSLEQLNETKELENDESSSRQNLLSGNDRGFRFRY